MKKHNATLFTVFWLALAILLLIALIFVPRTLDPTAPHDRLIGVLITTTPLSDANAKYPAVIRPEEAEGNTPLADFGLADSHPLLAAQMHQRGALVWISDVDTAITHPQFTINGTNAGDNLTLSGTIYLTPQAAGQVFILNPIHQADNGDIYAVQGQGVSFTGDLVDGMSSAQTMQDNITVRRKGLVETLTSTVEVTFQCINTPTTLTIQQFNNAGSLLASETYSAEALPTSLTPLPNADYFVTISRRTTLDGSEQIIQELTPADKRTLSTFVSQENGLCINHSIEIR